MARFLECFEEELESMRCFQGVGMRQRLDPDELGEELSQSFVIEMCALLYEMQKGAFLDLPQIGVFHRTEMSFSFLFNSELCEDISQHRYRLDDFLRENANMMRLRKRDTPLWKQVFERPLNDFPELNVCGDMVLEFFSSWLLDSVMRKDKFLKHISFEKIQEAVFLFLHDLIVYGYSVELPGVGVFGPLGFDPDDDLLRFCQTLEALDKSQQNPCPVEFITLRVGPSEEKEK